MKCNFKVGQKVACALNFAATRRSNSIYPQFNGIVWPEQGSTYTIREMEVMDSDHIGLRFEEIVNPVRNYFHGPSECAFDYIAFRPLTDISSLEELLNKAPPPELVVDEHRKMSADELKKQLADDPAHAYRAEREIMDRRDDAFDSFRYAAEAFKKACDENGLFIWKPVMDKRARPGHYGLDLGRRTL